MLSYTQPSHAYLLSRDNYATAQDTVWSSWSDSDLRSYLIEHGYLKSDEQKKREEEERIRREAEEKRRQEEERKRKEEEAKRKQKALEEEENRRRAEAQREQEAREAAEAQERKALGVTTAFEDWKRARDVLKVRVSAVSTSRSG